MRESFGSAGAPRRGARGGVGRRRARRAAAPLLLPLWRSVRRESRAGGTHEDARQGEALLVSRLRQEVHQRKLHPDPPAHPHGGEAVPLLPVRPGLPHGVLAQAARDAALRGAAVRLLHLREDVPDKLVPHGALPDPHQGQALRLQRLREGLLQSGGTEGAPQAAHRRETLRVRRVREELHLPPGSAAASAHARREKHRPDQAARQAEATHQAGCLTVDAFYGGLLLAVFGRYYSKMRFFPALLPSITAGNIIVSENMLGRVAVDCQESSES